MPWGYATNFISVTHAVLWNNGTITDLGVLGTPGNFISSEANDINNKGQVVGWSYINISTAHAFLYSGGAMIDMNSLIPTNPGWTLGEGIAINDNGQIVGRGTNPSGQGHAFLLTPVPEPSTSVLLTLGAVTLLGSRRLRRW
jgi:probable HAF family extracellular repeat protein